MLHVTFVHVQQQSGVSYNIMAHPARPLLHVKAHWIPAVCDFLATIYGHFHLHGINLPRPNRQNDRNLMEFALICGRLGPVGHGQQRSIVPGVIRQVPDFAIPFLVQTPVYKERSQMMVITHQHSRHNLQCLTSSCDQMQEQGMVIPGRLFNAVRHGNEEGVGCLLSFQTPPHSVAPDSCCRQRFSQQISL